MQEDLQVQQTKRRRGRPRKNPGDPVMHYKKRDSEGNVIPREDAGFDNVKYYIPYFPDKSLDVYEPYLNMYFEAMYERQMMWKRKVIDKIDSDVYTADPVFLKFKTFANVYRELDDSAQWSIQTIVRNKSLSTKDIVWKVLVYRLFNKPETFELASLIWEDGIPSFQSYEAEKEKFSRFMQLLKALEAKPFTNAYTIASSFAPGESWVNAYTNYAMPEFHKNIDFLMDTMLVAEKPTDIIDALKTLPGVSTFMSNEIYQDLMYINRFSGIRLFNFTEDDWVNVGPGSSLCLRAIFPNLETRDAQREGIYHLKAMAEEKLKQIGDRCGEPMPYPVWDEEKGEYSVTDKCNLTLCQIEDWLCEFSRYWRMYIRMYVMPKEQPIVSDAEETEECEAETEEHEAETEENDLM